MLGRCGIGKASIVKVALNELFREFLTVLLSGHGVGGIKVF